MDKDRDWERLASYARAARGSRSQKAIASSGGPSHTTLGKIERNEWRPTRGVDDTIAKLEMVYGWEPGSADAVLAGGEPVERPGLDHDPVADQKVVIDTVPGGLLHVSNLLWASIRDLADLSVVRANDDEVMQASRSAVFLTADVLTDLLLASPDAKASKELLQEMFATVRRYEEARRQSPQGASQDLPDDPEGADGRTIWPSGPGQISGVGGDKQSS